MVQTDAGARQRQAERGLLDVFYHYEVYYCTKVEFTARYP